MKKKLSKIFSFLAKTLNDEEGDDRHGVLMLKTTDGEELIVYASGKESVQETIGRIKQCDCPACTGTEAEFMSIMKDIAERVLLEDSGKKLH